MAYICVSCHVAPAIPFSGRRCLCSMRAAPVIGFTHPKSHLIFIVIFILTSPRKKSVKCVQIFSTCDHVVTRRWYTEYKSVTESPKFDTLRRNTMETNRMMSPAARRLAAVVLAALLCLSLFWRLADRRAVRRSIGLHKRTARRAGDGGAGGAIAFYAEMPAAEISAAGIFDSFPFFALAHRRLSITKLVSATPCRSTCCSRMTRYPLFSKKGFAVIDAWVLITPAHTCSSLSQRAVATPLP